MKMEKKTLVLGASTKPERYAYKAVSRLKQYGLEAVPIGLREGTIEGIEILKGQPNVEDVHTVTLYLNPKRQEGYYDYILGLKPARIIYNPGTENPTLMHMAKAAGIENVVACTLVMLSIGDY